MRVLLLADRSFASRERTMIARLEIGLADEGVRVVRASPQPPPPEALDNPFLRWIRFPQPTSKYLAPLVARAMLRDIEDSRAQSSIDAEPIDIVHVLGDESWSTGESLARLMGASVVYELWSEAALERALRVARVIKGEENEAKRRVAMLCPDEGVDARIAAVAPWTPRRVATWGVHSPTEQPSWPRRPGAMSILMIGRGEDLGACRDALLGLSELRKAMPNLLVFLDAELVRRSTTLWKHAERLNMLDCVSVVEDMESRRELSLHVDVLMIPERLPEHRTIVLDAMAHGVLVVAASGCPMTVLRPDDTAIVLERPRAEDWRNAMQRFSIDVERARAMVLSAANMVREHRLGGAYVRGALSAYESLAGAEPLAFKVGSRVP
ncbi:MAG: hypothetical protein KF684_10210 [Phycisphaeraceae bacterium]|nr:hypothetical protein [Phycisphaeraceae bacterium]